MELFNSLGVLMGGAWASGIRFYMTTAILGFAHRMHWVNLPGDLGVISHPLIILAAAAMTAVEFVADKVPAIDNIWDSIHTFIRPVGGAALGYMATANLGPVAQIPVAMFTGAISTEAHLTKATARVAINSSSAGIGSPAASTAEDGLGLVILYFVIKHPIIATIIAILLILICIWILKKLFRFIVKIFRFFTGNKQADPDAKPKDAKVQ